MITISTLSNGMRVLTDFLPQRETVNLGLWIKVGSRHELAGQNGISHLLEHMTFRGIPSYSAGELARAIEAVGGHLNAYTSREATSYYARILKKDIALAIDLIAEMVQEPLLPEEELEREKDVILQEIGQTYDTPDEALFDYFQESAFPDQALGRPITGTLQSVSNFEREDLVHHLKHHYHPSNMIFVTSGDIDHQSVTTRLEGAFSSANTGSRLLYEKAKYEGRIRTIQKPLERVHLLLGFEGLSLIHDFYYAQSLLSMILGGGISSRLFQEIREKKGLVYSIQTFTSAFTDAGLFALYAGTSEKNLKELMSLLKDQLLSLPRTLAEEEIERRKNQLKASLLTALEHPATRTEQMACHMLAHGRPLDVYEIIDRIEAVTSEHLISVAQKILASRPTLTAIGPLKNIPDFSFSEPLALTA